MFWNSVRKEIKSISLVVHLRNNAGAACEGESNSIEEFSKGQNKAFGQREVFRRSFTLDMAVK